jgi:hypothetical protein
LGLRIWWDGHKKILTHSSLFLFLFPPQSVHFSGTEQERLTAEFSSNQKMTSYFSERSSVDQHLVFPTSNHRTLAASSYLNVWNVNTPEYENIKPLVEVLPFEEIMSAYYPKDGIPDKRGNLQVNFGFAGGSSHEKRTSEQVFVDYGVAVPSTRTGTMDPLVVQTFKAMSDLAKRLRVRWSCPLFLEANPAVKERLGRFAGQIDDAVILELLSCLFSDLVDGDTRTYKHKDKENCPELSEVVACSRVMRNPFGR